MDNCRTALSCGLHSCLPGKVAVSRCLGLPGPAAVGRCPGVVNIHRLDWSKNKHMKLYLCEASREGCRQQLDMVIQDNAPQQVLLDAGAKMVGKAQLNQLVCALFNALHEQYVPTLSVVQSGVSAVIPSLACINLCEVFLLTSVPGCNISDL